MRAAAAPFHVMAKPIGALCNARCDYCFYLSKEKLYPGKSGESDFRMSDETLERFVASYLQSQPEGTEEVHFGWQGGEPTLLGVAFFDRAVELQRRYARPGQRVYNALQTNGTLLDDRFAAFLAREDFLVGLSIDGPEPLHDRYRRDAAGRGTFRAAMAGLEALRRQGVRFNTLSSVHRANAEEPEAVYDFLTGIGSTYLQFIPIVEPDGETVVSERTVLAEQWGRFMNGVFHRWRRRDIGRIFVQHFDLLLGIRLGYPASLCVHAPVCGRSLAIEHNGDVYGCDHFVAPEHLLGNLRGNSLAELVEAPAQRRFGESKRSSLPEDCLACSFLDRCFGACPKDRLLEGPTGRRNWLCRGYRDFYGETEPYFDAMAAALRSGATAADYRCFLSRPPR